MTTRVIQTEQDRFMLAKFMEVQALPFTVNVAQGKKRSDAQNRLQRRMVIEISEQLGDKEPEEVRGYCKLHIGVPIMRAEDEKFCAVYDKIIRPLQYEDKLAMMMVPMDLPVTRIMSTRQKTTYLDGICRHFAERGVVVTMPGDMMG